MPATAVVPDIAVLNESSVVTNEQIKTWTAAVQRQLNEHVLPYWGLTAKLHPLPQGSPRPSDAWWMLVTDDSDMANALGYHDLGSHGQPMGKVFANTTNSMGWGDLESPSRVLSHETIELVVDPFMVRIIDLSDAEYLVEPGDPVFLPTQGYRIDGVLVSDWATPAYYHYNTDRRYDHEGYLSAPCPAMIHGTYLMYRNGSTGPWLNKQMLEGAPGPELDRLRYLMRPRSGSRRYRRMVGRDNWVSSTAEPPLDFGDLVARATPKAGAPALPLINAGTGTFPSGTWNLGPINVQWNLKQGNGSMSEYRYLALISIP